ncbi:MAG: hypothetical protein R3F02_08395 [Thiolinea sp.]
MIEGLKPYPEYQDSNQKWLGECPSHWKILPNRAIFEEIKDKNHPTEEMLSVTIKRGIVTQKSYLQGHLKKIVRTPINQHTSSFVLAILHTTK